MHLFQNSSSESKSAEDCVSGRGSGVQRWQVMAGVRSGAEMQVQAVVAVMVVCVCLGVVFKVGGGGEGGRVGGLNWYLYW